MSQIIKTFINGYSKAFALIGQRTILVDCGPKGNSQAMKKALMRIGVSPSDVSLIIITHGHPDHVGALTALRELTGASVLCHEFAAEGLAEGWGEAVVPRTTMGHILARLTPKNSEKNRCPIKVDIKVTDETDLAAYGVSAKIIHTPGHTAGSLSVVTDDGDAIIGDLIMKFGPGKPGLSFLSNDVDQLRGSLAALLEAGVQRFHLAHGGMIDRASVEDILKRSPR